MTSKPSKLYLETSTAGPPAGTELCKLSELEEHGGKAIEFREGNFITQIFAQRLENTVRVFENRCPHAGTPLNLFGDRFMDFDGQFLLCRTHGAKFDPDTGLCVMGPCKKQYLREIAVTIEDGSIYSA